jgi:hypothetical protein
MMPSINFTDICMHMRFHNLELEFGCSSYACMHIYYPLLKTWLIKGTVVFSWPTNKLYSLHPKLNQFLELF